MSIFFKFKTFIFVLGLLLVSTSFYEFQKNSNKVLKNTQKENVKITATFSKLEGSCEDGNCTEDCCNKSKGCGHNDCDGNCNVTSCFTIVSCAAAYLPFLEIQKNESLFPSLKNSRFHYKNSFYSFGLHTIWQPPKIG